MILIFFCLYTHFAPVQATTHPSLSAVAAVEKAFPAVVFIAVQTNPFDLSYGPNPGYFYEFFRPFYESFWPPMFWHGSGFIISEDGLCCTCAHVVEGATSILVVLPYPERRICKASVVGKDPRTDIAVLKIENDDNWKFPYLQLGDSNELKLGEEVVLIGTPQNEYLESSVSVGAISGKERSHGNFLPLEGYIQTDVVANPGNSGGPLLNLNGDVVGLISWQHSHFWGAEGLSFAVPSNHIQLIVKQLVAYGKTVQGFLGVEFDSTQEEVFIYYFDDNKGARIQKVIENSPAARAGLTTKDVIIGVNGYPIKSAASFNNYISLLEPNTKISLTIDHEGEVFELSITLE